MAEPAGRVITAALVVVPGPDGTVTGAAAYPRALIAGRLARERITMTSLLTGETFATP